MDDICFNIFGLNDHYIGRNGIGELLVMYFSTTIYFLLTIVLSSEFCDEKRIEAKRKKVGHRKVKKRTQFFERAWYTNLFLVGGKDKIHFKYYIYRYVPMIAYVLLIVFLTLNQIFVLHWMSDLFLISINVLYYSGNWLLFRFCVLNSSNNDKLWMKIILIIFGILLLFPWRLIV